MELMQKEVVLEALQQFIGKSAYLHMEVNPGAYLRNSKVRISDVHVLGDNPFRIYLQLDDGQALLQMDNVTHMLITQEMVITTGYDEYGRLARTIEVAMTPFDVVGGE